MKTRRTYEARMAAMRNNRNNHCKRTNHVEDCMIMFLKKGDFSEQYIAAQRAQGYEIIFT